MRTFAIDENNDIFLSGGNIAIVTGLEAVQAICKNTAQTMLGELIFDQETGMPNFETIWARGISSIPFWTSKLRGILTSVDGVTSIESIDVSVSDGKLSYNARINTIYGTTTL